MIKGKQIDFAGEWKEIDFIGGLEEKTGEKFPIEFESESALAFLQGLLMKHNVACDEPRTADRYKYRY